MKNRMGVPKEYEPVLPGKVKAHIKKKNAEAEAAEERERQSESGDFCEACGSQKVIVCFGVCETNSPLSSDMQKCYEAIKKAREIRYAPRHKHRRGTGASHTHIPMAMWEVLQEVIEISEDIEDKQEL